MSLINVDFCEDTDFISQLAGYYENRNSTMSRNSSLFSSVATEEIRPTIVQKEDDKFMVNQSF